MRYLGLSAVLALAACNSGAEGDAAPAASESAAATALATAQPAAPLDPLALAPQQGPYAPRNDCDKEKGAADFRARLTAAVGQGDAEAIAALASPNVKLGFAGDDGRARLLAKLKAPDGELIGELRRLLPLGCAVSTEGNLTMPWYFAQDLGDIDGYAAMIVTAEDVPLHAAAQAGSQVRQRLSWDLVELTGGLLPDRPFQEVRLAGDTQAGDGQTGFVATDKLRSLLDYRLLASREDGEWRITALVAGD